MTPVISPWVFYLMPVSSKLLGISIALVCIGVVGMLITLGVYVDDVYYMKEDDKKVYKSIGKKLLCLTLVFLFLVLIIPSGETITKMIVAQNVTYERVEAVSDTVTTVYNDIMDLFEESGDSDG